MFLRTSRQDLRDVERSQVASFDVSHDVVRRSKSFMSTAVGSTRWLVVAFLARDSREHRLRLSCSTSSILEKTLVPSRALSSPPPIFSLSSSSRLVLHSFASSQRFLSPPRTVCTDGGGPRSSRSFVVVVDACYFADISFGCFSGRDEVAFVEIERLL